MLSPICQQIHHKKAPYLKNIVSNLYQLLCCLVAKDVLDQAVKAYKSTHKGVEIKTIELYIVANEGAAYYVVNGEGNDDFKIML